MERRVQFQDDGTVYRAETDSLCMTGEGLSQPQPKLQQLTPNAQPQEPEPLQRLPLPQETPSWILHLRTTPQNSIYTPSIIQVRISPDMDAVALSKALQQITGRSESLIVGLIEESSGIYSSLDHLLHEKPSRDIFLLQYMPRPVAPKNLPWWKKTEVSVTVGAIVLLTAAFFYGSQLLHAILYYIFMVYNLTIQRPLQELYRYGPSFIGWEGESLSRICAKITYHGDAAFWAKNMVECEEIFLAKEEAFLRVTRPVVYALVLCVLGWLVQQIIVEFLRRPRHPPRTSRDRDMQETYQAIQTLLQMVQRSMAPRVSGRSNDRVDGRGDRKSFQ